jgi:hypothetical protein
MADTGTVVAEVTVAETAVGDMQVSEAVIAAARSPVAVLWLWPELSGVGVWVFFGFCRGFGRTSPPPPHPDP